MALPAVAGVAVSGQTEQGQMPGSGSVSETVKLHVYGAAMGTPAPLVALTEAVYVAP